MTVRKAPYAENGVRRDGTGVPAEPGTAGG
jgi:hypothetical protein